MQLRLAQLWPATGVTSSEACLLECLRNGLPSYCGPCGGGLPHHCTTSVRMSVIVNYLKSRMEILILNARSGVDPNTQQYEELPKSAVNAIKQVCLGVKGVPPQELTVLLQAITDAPLNAQYSGELRDLFNQKLSNDPSLSLTSTACVKVDFPENYLRKEDWDKLMDSGTDVNAKLLYLATLWANLGLVHPSEKSSNNIAALGVLTEQEVVSAGPHWCSALAHIQKVP